jgi:hypothetical protein
LRELLAVPIVLVGLVFIGQGLGLIRGRSFMVGDIRWTVIGVVVITATVGAVLVARRRHS